jgi:hypothetical protein
MKKTFLSILLTAGVALFFSSCIKQDDPVFDSPATIELDLATFTARTGGFPFPIVNRVPQAFGRQVYTGTQAGGAPADPVLSRTWLTSNPRAATQGDTVYMRVNLVGLQKSQAQTFTAKVNTSFTTGTEGTHFELVDKSFTIPANSSFGFVRWRVLNPGAPAVAGVSFQVVFDIVGNGEVSANPNYQTLGWLIAQ